MAAVGSPLLILEAPQNAPAGGAYLLVLYPGQAGPQQVDWYWQPPSAARMPARCRVLFDQAGVPPLPEPAPLGGEERARVVSEKFAVFWVAALIDDKGSPASGHGRPSGCSGGRSPASATPGGWSSGGRCPALTT